MRGKARPKDDSPPVKHPQKSGVMSSKMTNLVSSKMTLHLSNILKNQCNVILLDTKFVICNVILLDTKFIIERVMGATRLKDDSPPDKHTQMSALSLFYITLSLSSRE